MRKNEAFTLTGLLVVIVTTGFLVLILLPTLSGARMRSQSTQCLNNQKQLILAAQMYADDSRGIWFYNQPEGESQSDWVTVIMDWGGTFYGAGPVATNWQRLVTAPATMAPCSGFIVPSSYFTPYIRDPFVYKCPADPSTINGVPRVRSYSANGAVGTAWCAQAGWNTHQGGPVTGQWLNGSDNDSQTYGRCFQKVSDMTRPSPADLFVFGEEHPDSISDSSFMVQIASTGLGGDWIDLPGNLHNGAGSFSFADGHVEMHQWVGPLISDLKFVNGGNDSDALPQTGGVVTSHADVKDLNWVQARTSSPINPAINFPNP